MERILLRSQLPLCSLPSLPILGVHQLSELPWPLTFLSSCQTRVPGLLTPLTECLKIRVGGMVCPLLVGGGALGLFATKLCSSLVPINPSVIENTLPCSLSSYEWTLNTEEWLGVEPHACNTSSWEVEARRWLQVWGVKASLGNKSLEKLEHFDVSKRRVGDPHYHKVSGQAKPWTRIWRKPERHWPTQR